jgi:hypothetical protein
MQAGRLVKARTVYVARTAQERTLRHIAPTGGRRIIAPQPSHVTDHMIGTADAHTVTLPLHGACGGPLEQGLTSVAVTQRC